MRYFTVKPSATLSDFVQYFWIFEGKASDQTPFNLRTPASGFAELLFHYKGIFQEVHLSHTTKTSFVSGIHGQGRRHREFVVSRDFGMIGAQLYPYALHSLFGIPGSAFVNELPDLYSFLDPVDRCISQRVLEAEGDDERISLISDFLLKKVNTFRRPEVVFAVKEIIARDGVLSLETLIEQCSISQRQFQRNFKEHTGFSAKTFSRIIRFNALINKSDFKNQSLTDIALTFGYYDQAHFIQDFKEFSGVNPRAFFENRKLQF